MSDQEINMAIAEACGWRVHPDNRWIVIPPNSPNSVQPLNTIPDYCNDLNAMHESEKKLIFSERKLFRYWLQKVKGSAIGDDVMIAIDECVHSTARQRAEAFVRTIGKWEEAAK